MHSKVSYSFRFELLCQYLQWSSGLSNGMQYEHSSLPVGRLEQFAFLNTIYLETPLANLTMYQVIDGYCIYIY